MSVPNYPGIITQPPQYGLVTVYCDRCTRRVEGHRSPEFTAGFYDTSAGYWSKFATRNESVICDCCMFASAMYRAQYVGIHTCGKAECLICYPKGKKSQ